MCLERRGPRGWSALALGVWIFFFPSTGAGGQVRCSDCCLCFAELRRSDFRCLLPLLLLVQLRIWQ